MGTLFGERIGSKSSNDDSKFSRTKFLEKHQKSQQEKKKGNLTSSFWVDNFGGGRKGGEGEEQREERRGERGRGKGESFFIFYGE